FRTARAAPALRRRRGARAGRSIPREALTRARQRSIRSAAVMPRFLPVGKGVKGAAGFLLAAIPALGAVLTALAVTGDLVGRMARDHPLPSYGAFGFAVLAIFAGAVAAFA